MTHTNADTRVGARRIAVVLGTRPEAIKLAFVVKQLGDAAWVIHTGQHYDDGLGRNILDDLEFTPPHDSLDVGGAPRAQQIGEALSRLDQLFDRQPPAAVIVQGDTNATVAGALAANAASIPLAHVEAGLRSYDRRMPEEHNRVVTDHLSDLCCAATETNVRNLAAEGIAGDRVVTTGNTVVEAVQEMLPPPEERLTRVSGLGLESNGYVVATMHRPENVDERETLEIVLRELGALPVPVVLPLHPRSLARVASFGLEPLLDGVRIVEPMPPREFLALAAEAALWVSDSGGLQEEASILKRPVVVVRRSTERPEVLGTFSSLVAPAEIGDKARALLDDIDAVHESLASMPSPYGDGSASSRVVVALTELLDRAS